MGSEYTRNDSANNIADGNVISAADLDGEFEKLVTAFTAGTGHSHDGTTAEGGYVTKLLGTAITIGDGTAGTDIVVTFDGETNDGTLTWMEDEARFDFANKIKILDGTDVDVSDTTVGSLILAGGAVITKDLLVGDDIFLDSDSSVVKFGADQDITLTHAADTSLTLGGAGSTTGLIINNTATDGDPFLAFALSGTQTFTMGIEDGDSDKFKIGTSAIGTSTILTLTGDDMILADDLSLQSDGAIINFGEDDDISITHTADTSLTVGGAGSTTGVIINNTAGDGDPFLAFALSGTQTFTMGVEDGDSDKFKIGTTAIGTDTILTLTGDDVILADDLSLQSDSALLNFGADDDITLTHTADTSLTLGGAGGTTGLIVNNTAGDGDPFLAFALSGTQTFTMGIDDGDSDKFKIGTSAIGTNTRLTIDSSGNSEFSGDVTAKTGDGAILALQTSLDTVIDGSVLGTIQFTAPEEASDTDSRELAAEIAAVAEEAFSTTSNATELVFKTGASEAATSKMVLSSTGILSVNGGVIPTSADGAALGSATKEWSDLYLADSGVIYFGDDQDTTLTHTDGTGLTLNSTNKLNFGDTGTFINQSTDGQLDIDADTELELTAPTVDIAASTAVTIATPSLIITDNTTDEPIVQIKNTHNGTTAGELRFVMDKGAAGADGDDLGTISFYGDDAGQNQTAFAKIVGEVSEADQTDEAGKLSFFVAESDGTNTALTAGLVLEGEHATDGEVDVTIGAGVASTTSVAGILNVAGGAVFNEDSADVDFRIESNGNENMLFVDGGNNKVGIGGTPSVDLHIINASDEGTPSFAGATHFAVQASASSGDNCNMAITAGSAGTCRIMFGDKDDEDAGKIEYDNSGNDLAFFTEATERMTITSSLLSFHGTGSSANIKAISTDSSGEASLQVTGETSGGTARTGIFKYDNSDVLRIGTSSAIGMNFETSDSARLLILSGGNTVPQGAYFKASNATDKFYNGTDPSSGNWHEFNSNVGNEQILAITNHNTGTDNEGVVIRHVANTNNTSSGFISCGNDVNGTKFAVKGNGDVQSATNSYGSTSDERLKSDIKDANSQWNDIKQLRFRNFKKYDTENLVHLGLIAQEAEKISPNIVSDSKPSSLDIKHDASFGTLYTKDDSETQNNVLYTEDDQEVKDGDKKVGDIKTFAKKIGDVKEVKEKVKDIKYSVLYMKAVKALQEAMTRIETLETKVKALEDA